MGIKRFFSPVCPAALRIRAAGGLEHSQHGNSMSPPIPLALSPKGSKDAVGPAPKLALASNGQAGADTSPERSEWQHGVKFDIF